MKITAWDLECSSLNADYGFILCAGFKTVGEGRPEIISISDFPLYKSDPTNDRELCKAISARLLKAECWLGWYSLRFDLPFLNSRLIFHGLPILPHNYPHIDGWRTAKYRLKLRNNRLNTVQDFLQLPTEKDAVKGPVWIKAIAGHRPSLDYVINHCRKDVLVLEEAYEKLRPLIIDHPYNNLVDRKGGCPTCSKASLQKRGMHITRTRTYQRYHCQSCGAWSRATVPGTKATIKGY